MNSQTYRLFKMAVDQLHKENVNVEYTDFPKRVYQRYIALDKAQRFVSTMLQGDATKPHSADKLATGYIK